MVYPSWLDVLGLVERRNPADIQIREGDLRDLRVYSEVPVSFVVDRILLPVPKSSSHEEVVLEEIAQSPPYAKDYDAIPGAHPTEWPLRFDISGWGLVSAWRGGTCIGGAVLVQGSPDVDMLEGRDDLAVLWDFRVAPQERRTGVGSALFAGVERWARSRGCTELKVETKNINVPACRFYRSRGFTLRDVNEGAYPELPKEIQLLWYKRLRQRSGRVL